MNKILLFIFLTISISHAQNIQSGPMLGYSEMREVLIWVQTKSPASIKARYWVAGKPDEKFVTDEYKTLKSEAFTARLIADKVQPDNTYEYEIWVNGKQEKFSYPLTFQSQSQWQWRKEAPDFKFALGSCTYINEPVYDRPGEPYGNNYEIFDAIKARKPDFMIWLGDNAYLREADWNTKTGIFHRYTHSRSVKEMQPLLASTHNYAIWDDHDFGPNDSDRSFWNKPATLETFKLFWGNPSYGFNGSKGIETRFQWSDCEFFMLDNRYNRQPVSKHSSECTILGKEQLTWFIDALGSSKATFKFVAMGGQFLNPIKQFETYNNICSHERDSIISIIKKENIPGVIFLTGDRHHSEVSKLEKSDLTPLLYDITISPLTSGVNKKAESENNTLRIPGSVFTDKNFGLIEISGVRTDRKLKLGIYNNIGEEKWSVTINSKDFK